MQPAYAIADEAPLAAPRPAIRAPAWGPVVTAALGTRLLIVLCMAAGTYFPRVGYRFWTGLTPDGLLWAYDPSRWLDGFGRWDTWYYLRLAAVGYLPPSGDWAHEAAFFPFFPMLVRGISELTGLSLFHAGLVVAWVCFALAIRAVYVLFRDVAGEARAAEATIALLVFPGSLFLTAVYTESLFLLLSVTALHAARRRAFGLAGIAAALATWTRPNGLLLGLPLAIELFLAWRRRERVGYAWPLLALPAVALGAHCAWQSHVYGDPFYFQHVQAVWGRHFSGPWVALFEFHFDPEYYLITLGALLAVGQAWRARQPASLQTHGALSILLPLSTGTLKSMPRFVGVDFPLFLALSERLRSRRARALYTAGALLLLVVYAFRVARADAIN
jgi:hypothetical protein